MEPLRIHGHLILPAEEIEVRTSRSGGPGGQNVNKVETQVELRFSVRGSHALGDARRARLLERLASRLTANGVLIVRSSKHRERSRNLEDARSRLAELVRSGLVVPKARRPTSPTAGSRRRRREEKDRRASVKRTRRPTSED
jgi:ribosome-associated protein